jgi:hypothetical protein
MEAADQLLLILASIFAWLYLSLYLALWRQKRRSPLRIALLASQPLFAILLVLGAWLVS